MSAKKYNSRNLHDSFQTIMTSLRLPYFSRMSVPICLIESMLKFPFHHEVEFCGYFVGQVRDGILHVKFVEWRGNLLLDLAANREMCLDYLKVAENPTPQSESVSRKLFWFFLNERNLRERALEVLKGSLTPEKMQKLIEEEAKTNSISSNNRTILGDEAWYHKYEKESLRMPETYCRVHFHSHPLGEPILPSSADISSQGLAEEIFVIVQIEPSRTLSMLAYQSSGPCRTILNYFFPITRTKKSLKIRLDTPKEVIISGDYEEWRSCEELGQKYVFCMSLD